MTTDDTAWKENAQNGWAVLHNIREVLTQLAPPGSLPDEAEFTYGPEHVHEAAVLIDAIHALHARAVNAEQEAVELRKLLEEAAPLIHSAGVPSAPDAFSDEPEAMTEVLTPDAEVLEARRLEAKIRAYISNQGGRHESGSH